MTSMLLRCMMENWYDLCFRSVWTVLMRFQASVGGDGKVILWNLEGSEILWSVAGHRRSISCVDYHVSCRDFFGSFG